MNYDFDEWPAIGMLIMLGIVFRLLSLFFLWFRKGRIQWLYIANIEQTYFINYIYYFIQYNLDANHDLFFDF